MDQYIGLIICVPVWIIFIYLFGSELTGIMIFIHVVVVPLLFWRSPLFRRAVVFANFVKWPGLDLDRPASCGIKGGRNIFVDFHSSVDNCYIELGVWHILPLTIFERLKDELATLNMKEQSDKFDAEMRNSTRPVIIYCHGNSNTRGSRHRVKMYQFFQRMDYHTIAFDYRGFGDSTPATPSEAGLVEDTLHVYEWVRTTALQGAAAGKVKPPAVFVWGHSLGTAISASMIWHLPRLSAAQVGPHGPTPPPNALLLEAPFNNLPDQVRHMPLAKLISWLPYFEYAVVGAFVREPLFNFYTDFYLANLNKLPVLILHAEDDFVVPYHLGTKLYKHVQRSRNHESSCLQLQSYETRLRLGHQHISRAPDLDITVGEFVNNHRGQCRRPSEMTHLQFQN